MSHYDYDLFVIGAGSGGVRGARMAAQAGARVAIAEEHRVGGTCVIRGCVPKKLFVYASHFHSDLEDMRGYGWTVDGATFDWRTLRENKDNEIDRLNGLYLKNLVGAGVELFEERATLEDAHTVRLQKSDKTVTAETILIATGGRPFVPDIPGAELGITSDDAFYLDELPKTIAIIGGGYIAVEFAGIFKGLGVEPTIHYRGPQILRGFDQDMRDGLDTALANRGIHVIPQSEPSRLTGENGRITMETRNGNTVQTDMVMFATGREAHTKGLGLESAGVTTAPSGAITVDEYS
ncbi:MAG: FAD-dependent oxidoreductase, partial [Planctomycetota bacterium]